MYYSAREFEPLRLSCVIFEVTYNADLGVEHGALKIGGSHIHEYSAKRCTHSLSLDFSRPTSDEHTRATFTSTAGEWGGYAEVQRMHSRTFR